MVRVAGVELLEAVNFSHAAVADGLKLREPPVLVTETIWGGGTAPPVT
jgi:hypothetical protein